MPTKHQTFAHNLTSLPSNLILKRSIIPDFVRLVNNEWAWAKRFDVVACRSITKSLRYINTQGRFVEHRHPLINGLSGLFSCVFFFLPAEILISCIINLVNENKNYFLLFWSPFPVYLLAFFTALLAKRHSGYNLARFPISSHVLPDLFCLIASLFLSSHNHRNPTGMTHSSP